MKHFYYSLFVFLFFVPFTAFSQSLTFSVERGFYSSPFQVTITSSIGGNIRYTTNGTPPSMTSGTIYSGPISVNTTTVLRAIGYTGGSSTPVTTHTYLFLADVIQQPANISGWPNNSYSLGNGSATAVHDYEMDPAVVTNPSYSSSIIPGLQEIPSLCVVMDKDDFWDMYDGEDEWGASVELLFANNPSGNEQFDCGIESHSHLRLKRSMRLVFDNAYFPSLNSKIIKSAPYNSTATDHFDNMKIVLRGGNNRAWSRNWNPNRTCFTRDEWYRQSFYEATGIGSRGNFYHLYVNGLYWGLYNAVERPDHGFLAEYLGGDSDDYFSNYHDGVRSGDQTRFNYLTGPLVDKDISVLANYQELTEYLDVAEFSDYLIVTWMTGMSDWPTNNFYGGNRNVPTGPQMYFAWDCEWSWDNTHGSNQGAWVHPSFEAGDNGGPQIAELFNSAKESEEYITLFGDRVYKQCFNNGPLTDDNSRARWQMLNDYISNAVIAESARWGDGIDDGTTRTKNGHWQPEVDRVDGLMDGNVEQFIDALRDEGYYPSIDPPDFNQESGQVASSFTLTMSNPNGTGTIYFTTDGTDPRAIGGGISGSASTYAAGVPVGTGLMAKARVKDGSEWSALHEANLTIAGVAIANLFINEFLASNVNDITDEAGDHEDWIEIYNDNNTAVDIGGLYITDDLTDPLKFQLLTSNPSATTIPAKGFLLIWADNELTEGPLHITPKLGKGGEAIGLVQVQSGTPVFLDSLTFGPQADDISTGRYPDGTPNMVTFSTTTPGASNSLPFAIGLFINEFLAGNVNDTADEAGDHEDWIEIYNSNNTPVDIGGFFITDDLGNMNKFQLPTANSAATTIPANGFVLLWADNELGEGPLHISPTLDVGGEAIGLVQELSGIYSFIDSLTFGVQTNDISRGRYPDGSSNLTSFISTTPGSSNIIPLISGLYINEYLASNDTSFQDEFGDNDDWFEIYNSNAFPVNIGGLFVTDNLGTPDKWQMPTNEPTITTIPAGGFMIIWADQETDQGPLHANIKLSAGGEEIALVQINGTDIFFIDSLTFGPQVTDQSEGRYPDGSSAFYPFSQMTPGASNVLFSDTSVSLNIAVFLGGPYDTLTGLMSDTLRKNGLIPLLEPYTALDLDTVAPGTFLHAGPGGGETMDTSVLLISGDSAVVDWIYIQLRSKNDSTQVLATRSALLLRNGKVVDVDGISPLSFAGVAADDYYVVVRHRNHLGVMTLNTLPLSSTPLTIDFTAPETPTYGSSPQDTQGGKNVLWSGNVVYNREVKYSGSDNDRDPILVEIGGTIPTAVSFGYKTEDVNLDGAVKYSGPANDRDPILVNIGGVVPTAVRAEQVP